MVNTNYTDFTNTYSIVAFDPVNNQLGVAMQTHNFAACNRVIYAEPGVGVVASQSFTNPIYGFNGLEMMRKGKLPKEILKDLLKQDVDAEYRQVGIVDAKGNVAVHTGANCIKEAGHRTGKYYSCQANMMLKATVWDQMSRAFENCDGELVDCIMNAMDAAEAEGGDMRGAQCAGIIIVSAELTDKPWSGYIYDFKVYDNSNPLKELRRLVNLKKANNYIESFHALLRDEKLDKSKLASIINEFTNALEKIPNEDSKLQHQVNYAMSLLKLGFEDEAISLFKITFAANPIWKKTAARIARAESNEYICKIIDSL